MQQAMKRVFVWFIEVLAEALLLGCLLGALLSCLWPHAPRAVNILLTYNVRVRGGINSTYVWTERLELRMVEDSQ